MKALHMNIKGRLLMLVASLAVLVFLLGGFGTWLVSYINSEYQRIFDEDSYATTVAVQSSRSAALSGSEFIRSLQAVDSSRREDALAAMRVRDQEADSYLALLKERCVSERSKEMVADLQQKLTNYRQARQAFMSARGRAQAEQPLGSLPEAGAYYNAEKQLADSYNVIIDFAGAAAGKEMEVLSGEVMRYFVVSGIVTLILLAVVLIFALRQTSSISWRLNKLSEEAAVIAGGDLVTPILILADDEIGAVATSFETMRKKMNGALLEMRMAADQVAGGAKNVSDASVSLSQGAAEQAASVEQLSASIAEISSQTKSNAENAEHANGLTQEACDQAAVGDADMQAMLEAMEAINHSSENISKIIKVIDEIAFQTNILALNAAVEAARAGQHGKGFAVVAEEVRNLAARSAKAAKETTDMIEDSIKKVEGGREIAGKTAEALRTIRSQVNQVTELVAGIAKASQEQRLALEQINQGVLQVSQVVQGNSATSEEAASASQELSAQADRMQETAGRFRLEQQGGNWQGPASTARLVQQPPKRLADDRGITFQPPAISQGQPGGPTDFGKY